MVRSVGHGSFGVIKDLRSLVSLRIGWSRSGVAAGTIDGLAGFDSGMGARDRHAATWRSSVVRTMAIVAVIDH